MSADARPVVIVDYDPAWPQAFEHERALIAAALGELLRAIEHVGSTAVPGLAAKPIIDIMIGVRDLGDGERCVAPLESIEYDYKGEQGIPGRFYFGKGEPRTHHVHLVEDGSAFWVDHLLFRDYLRAHPEALQAYAALKRTLAAQYGADREGYTDAKSPFIRSAVRRALAERERAARP